MTLSDYRTALDSRSPVRAWEHQETSGTALVDRKAVQNGTLAGSPTLAVSGPASGVTAINYAASGSATVPDHNDTDFGGTTAHSLVFWIKLATTPTAYARVLTHEGASNAGWAVQFEANTNSLRWRRGATYYLSNNSLTLTLGVWYMVTLVFTGTRAQAYLNKTLVMDWASTTSVTATTEALTLARAYYGGERPDAALSLVSLHSVALTQSDVTTLYDALLTGGGGDVTPPTVSNLAATPGSTSASVTATTNEPASLSIEYGTTTSYGSTATGSAGQTVHSVSLTGLSASTLYHYRARATDGSGNVSAWSADQTFTTTAAGATTLQGLIDGATAGSTVTIPAGTYREAVTVNKALTLVGGPDTVLTGSDDWSTSGSAGNTWTASGSYWLSSLSGPNLAAFGDTRGFSPAGLRRVQVFVDGVEQEILADGSTPASGQACRVSSTDRRIRLGTNPSGKLVEVSVRERCVTVTASNVTLRGRSDSERWTIRHGLPDYQRGLVDWPNSVSANNLTLKWLDVSFGHTANIALYSLGSDPVVQFVRSHHAGQNGIDAGGVFSNTGPSAGPIGLVIEDSEVDRNNTRANPVGWHAGGIKVTMRRGTAASGPGAFVVQRNSIHDNTGAGLWCDTKIAGAQVLSNRVWRNSAYGIRFEVCDGSLFSALPNRITVSDNAVWQNGADGILIDTCSYVTVSGNLCAWNGRTLPTSGSWPGPAEIMVKWYDGRSEIAGYFSGGNGPLNVTLSGNDLITTADTRTLDPTTQEHLRRCLLHWQQDAEAGFPAGTLLDPSNTGSNHRLYLAHPTTLEPYPEPSPHRIQTPAYNRHSTLSSSNATATEEGDTYGWASYAALSILLQAKNIPLSPTAEPPGTTTPAPVLSNVAVGNVTQTSATVTATTSTPSRLEVQVGVTVLYGATVTGASGQVSHSVSLTDLPPGVLIHYRVRAVDSLGQTSAWSSDRTFTTLGADPDTGPAIGAIQVQAVTSVSLVVGWTTDRPATSQVEYGTSPAYGQATTLDPTLVTQHTVTVAGLLPNTTYYLRVRSTG